MSLSVTRLGLVCAALLLGLAVSQPAVAADTAADVQNRMRKCDTQADTAAQHHACVYKATPQKCRSYVSGARGKFYSPLIQQQWFVCLRSCDGASLLSRTRGECSTMIPKAAR